MPKYALELIIGLLGALLGAFGTYMTLRFNHKQLYAQTVSTNRMEWINIWRENISKFLACAEILHDYRQKQIDSEKCKKLLAIQKEFYEARAMIESRLNLQEKDHQLMLLLISQFSFSCTDEEFVKKREVLLATGRKILKPEWERVKHEAEG